MWSHVMCPHSTPVDLNNTENTALHLAWEDISAIGKPWNEWQWPIGQQIAIIKKQLEHRLQISHTRVPTCKPDCFLFILFTADTNLQATAALHPAPSAISLSSQPKNSSPALKQRSLSVMSVLARTRRRPRMLLITILSSAQSWRAEASSCFLREPSAVRLDVVRMDMVRIMEMTWTGWMEPSSEAVCESLLTSANGWSNSPKPTTYSNGAGFMTTVGMVLAWCFIYHNSSWPDQAPMAIDSYHY